MNEKDLLDEAIDLLESPNLIWSNDFETIRYHLYALLSAERKSLGPHQATYDIAEALLDGYNNDFTIG